MYSRKRKNVYQQQIRAIDLQINNAPRDKFCDQLLKLPYLMYRVDSLVDGREIVINKPGGKFAFGRVAREDFMVWIHDKSRGMVWLISHKDIYQDLTEKGAQDQTQTIRLIELLERVYNGTDPNDILHEIQSLNFTVGEQPELLLKAYKWIWGQEDCNYPSPRYQGRAMSMEGILDLKKSLLS